MALMAEEGIRALRRAPARRSVQRRATTSKRAAMRCTAPGCAARCSATSAWRLHHKLCHTLGGSFNLPHAEAHTVVLPHALAYNAAAAPEAMARIARALGRRHRRAARPCTTWRATLGAPPRCATSACRPTDLDRAADLAVQQPVPESAAARSATRDPRRCCNAPSKARAPTDADRSTDHHTRRHDA